VQHRFERGAQGALGLPAMTGPQVDIGPADEVEEHGCHLDGIDFAQRSVRDPVAQEPLERLGEDRAGQRLLGIVAMEDAVGLRLQRDEQRQAPLGGRSVSPQKSGHFDGVNDRNPEDGSGSSGAAAARIVLLEPKDASAAGAVLARSHADYPSFRHLFPDPARRARALEAMFTGIARDAGRLGSASGAVTDDGGVHGVAIWLAPGRFPWSAWRQLRGAGWMLSVLRAAPGSFRAFMKTGANGARLHPAYPHWYLETMGVDPAAQRKGLGGRLLEPVLEIADRTRVDCYLETADHANVEYYGRHGFVVENPSLQMVPDGPAHVAMRRRPIATGDPR
jgi:GNAT superfamily N-acetyltransferase